MQPNTFSIQECLRFGWTTFKLRPWFFVGITLLISFIDILIRLVTGHSKDASVFLSLADLVGSIAFGTVLSMGMVSFALKAHDAPMASEVKDLWPNLNRFWKYLGVLILSVVVIGIGFILLIIPGLIAMTIFGFSYYPVIERCLGPIEAMKESARITKGHRWEILGLFLVVMIINVVGLLALVIGLLVTAPITGFAIVHAYRILSASAPKVATVPSPVEAVAA